MLNAPETAPGGASGLLHSNPLETNPRLSELQSRAQLRLHRATWKVRSKVIDDLDGAADAALRKRAGRIAGCCQCPLYIVNADGKTGVRAGFCRDRLCPTCQRRRGQEAARRILGLVKGFESPRFMTLTLQAVDAPLRGQIDALFAAFRRIRKDSRWMRRCSGGVYALEVTRNAQTGLWHPHLHLIVEGVYYAQSELSIDWAKATGGSMVVDVRAVHDRRSVARYIAEYVSKPAELSLWPASALREYATGLHGRRLLHSWGCAHGTEVDSERGVATAAEAVCIVSAHKVLHADRGGCLHARYARSLLLRVGGVAAAGVWGADPGWGETAVPVEGWELVRLGKALRFVAGDASAALPDLGPNTPPTTLPNSTPITGAQIIIESVDEWLRQTRYDCEV